MRSIIPFDQNPALREVAQEIPVADISTPFIHTLINDMKKLLTLEQHGVAIAASQVGEPLSLFVVSGRALSERAKEEDESAPPLADQIYINPKLMKTSRRSKEKHEGCLSIRGKWGMVPRFEKATVQAYDETGKLFTRGASGFLAHIFQHELDHLAGILYTDKTTKLFDDKPEDEHANGYENNE